LRTSRFGITQGRRKVPQVAAMGKECDGQAQNDLWQGQVRYPAAEFRRSRKEEHSIANEETEMDRPNS
jgi:hypothetical protein